MALVRQQLPANSELVSMHLPSRKLITATVFFVISESFDVLYSLLFSICTVPVFLEQK